MLPAVYAAVSQSGQPVLISCLIETTDPQIQRIAAVLAALEELNTWIDEVPPLQSPQRFGNLAFREWGKRLEDVRPRHLGCLS